MFSLYFCRKFGLYRRNNRNALSTEFRHLVFVPMGSTPTHTLTDPFGFPNFCIYSVSFFFHLIIHYRYIPYIIPQIKTRNVLDLVALLNSAGGCDRIEAEVNREHSCSYVGLGFRVYG